MKSLIEKSPLFLKVETALFLVVYTFAISIMVLDSFVWRN